MFDIAFTKLSCASKCALRYSSAVTLVHSSFCARLPLFVTTSSLVNGRSLNCAPMRTPLSTSTSSHVVSDPVPTARSGIVKSFPSMTMTFKTSRVSTTSSLKTLTVTGYDSPGPNVLSLTSTLKSESAPPMNVFTSAGINESFTT